MLCILDDLPWWVGVKGREGEMVCKFVFLEIGVGDGIEGRKEGGAGVYRVVEDSVPDLAL